MKFLVETKRFQLNQTKEQAFNTDTILLSNYVSIPKVCKNVLDIGTGTGVIMFDLAFKTNAFIHGIEVQENRYNQTVENIKLNKLTDRLNVTLGNLKDYDPKISFDLIVSNPPFFKVNKESKLNDNEEEIIARHEVLLTLDELLENTSRLLKFKGHFYMIHRPDRVNEIISISLKYNLEVKNIRFIHPNINSTANHVLVHMIKNGGKGVIVEKPLILYKDKHVLTEEMEKIVGDF